MTEGVSAMWMRGGTSKGAFFIADDLPQDEAERDAFLLRTMGSPDPRQIDGMGGGDPLTSKVAIVKGSVREGIDVDYLFLQIFVDQALVSDAQNCGNMLAAVGPFAIERGLVAPTQDQTEVSIWKIPARPPSLPSAHPPGVLPMRAMPASMVCREPLLPFRWNFVTPKGLCAARCCPLVMRWTALRVSTAP
jgi:4-oxalomesaconate tautomerase